MAGQLAVARAVVAGLAACSVGHRGNRQPRHRRKRPLVGGCPNRGHYQNLCFPPEVESVALALCARGTSN